MQTVQQFGTSIAVIAGLVGSLLDHPGGSWIGRCSHQLGAISESFESS